MRRRGFSLVETLVGVVVFSLLVGVVFGLFEYGTRMFQMSVRRQGLQTEALRTVRWLESDLRRTHFDTITVVARQVTVDGKTLARDGICLGGVLDWNDPANFSDVSALPLWNSYTVYYATSEGALVRSVLAAAGADGSPMALATFSQSSHMRDDPAANLDQTGVSQLTQRVREFAVVEDETHRTIAVSLRLQDEEGEAYQVEMTLPTDNTWP